jgi:ferric-dicitrate binding protein FerR (iron transport regulator)
MESKKEHIRRLLVEKIADTISEEDNQWIEQEISDNQDARLMWEELRSRMQSDAAQSFLESLDAHASWRQVEQQILPQPERRRPVMYRWMAAAALLLLAGAAAFYLLPALQRPVTAAKNDSAGKPLQPAVKAVELQLANGTRINLSDSAHRLINLNGAQINTTEKGMQLANAAQQAEQQWSTLQVPPRLDYRVVLADGTEVWLNAASSLRFPFSFPGNTREVYLQGEAFFKVAPNRQQPFIVHTGAAEVKVLGTAFNVESYSQQQAVVSLTEGAVSTRLPNSSREATLQPGIQAVLQAGKGYELRPFKASAVLAWMLGVYEFHNTPLKDITAVLERWFALTVVFDNATLGNLRVTGELDKNKPLQVFLSSLETTAGIQTELQGHVLHLRLNNN